ncbi:MAG: agmatinase [Candidatus Heimdallarchaeota archaeon]|nr:agmatinase [Candidatus Heimdallarchaeota archaeon]
MNSEDYGSFGGIAYDTVDFSDAHVIIQGVPYEGSISGKPGASKAMDALRAASRDLQVLTRYEKNFEDLVLVDAGDIPLQAPIENILETIENRMIDLLSYHIPIISIGGDHSVSYPLIKACTSKGKVGVIWFDAHRDLLDELDGSPYSHGCPLRRALDIIDPNDILIVGTRYMTSEEQDVVDNMGIDELRMVDIEKYANFQKFIEFFQSKALELASRVDFLYVSIDIDVLDPAFAPGTGTPVAGGLSSAELMRLIRVLPNFNAVDVTEVSPAIDVTGITVKVLMAILSELLGKIDTNNHI